MGNYLGEPGTPRRRRAGIYAYRATLVAVVLVAVGAIGQTALSSTPASPRAEAPLAISVAPAPPTTAPPVTPEPPPVAARPAFIPTDSYAEEPIVEIGTIEIPAIGVASPIYQGVTLRNIDLGPSHWPGTALPGQKGNTVFAGHRVTRTRPFRDLDALVAGDQVIFTVNGTRSVYRVTDSFVVQPEDTWIADQTPTATGTLYACHPPGSAAQRIVVRLALA